VPEGEIRIDRRKHRRVAKVLRVAYMVMPKEEAEKDILLISKKYVESADISVSGIQLICDEQIEPDRIIRLDVYIDDESEPIATFAEVRWVRHDDKLKKYRTGLEFLVIKEDHIAIIRKITGEQ